MFQKSRAIRTRLSTSSLLNRLLVWALTVATVMPRRSAVSRLPSPSAMARAVSSSRRVRADSRFRAAARTAPRTTGPPAAVAAAMSRAVACGDRAGSPFATVRTASMIRSGGVCFRTKPSAPARSASRTSASESKAVRTMTRGGWFSARSSRVQLTPSRPGIRTSMSTTSGVFSRTRARASSPSAASPTTVRSLSPSTTRRTAIRISCSSSTTTTRTGGSPDSTLRTSARARRRAGRVGRARPSRPCARARPCCSSARARRPARAAGR